ncbi:hypothetical protein J6590_026524 [Homalodisca vitripennis]|nr:hypothetical protein J6590_026524 [Homalodisca vitripennis]
MPLSLVADQNASVDLYRCLALDSVPEEMVKVVVRTCPYRVLNVYNCCLKEGTSDNRWQTSLYNRDGKEVPREDAESEASRCGLSDCTWQAFKCTCLKWVILKGRKVPLGMQTTTTPIIDF